MGRTRSALAQPSPGETLAQWLESLRRRSGMSWDQMAQTAADGGLKVSRSTLHRAARGGTLPKWKTVRTFTRVCGGDEREAKRLWVRADRHRATTGGAPRAVVLRPEFISEPGQLVHAMRSMCRENGNPTLRELEKRAYIDVRNKVSLLPKSTVGAVLQGRMPARDLLLNFVRHCGNVPEDRIRDWADAWERADAYRRGDVRPEAANVREELARVEEELARTREQLERATAELARAARATGRAPSAAVPHRGPAALAPPDHLRRTEFTVGPPPHTTRNATVRAHAPSRARLPVNPVTSGPERGREWKR